MIYLLIFTVLETKAEKSWRTILELQKIKHMLRLLGEKSVLSAWRMDAMESRHVHHTRREQGHHCKPHTHHSVSDRPWVGQIGWSGMWSGRWQELQVVARTITWRNDQPVEVHIRVSRTLRGNSPWGQSIPLHRRHVINSFGIKKWVEVNWQWDNTHKWRMVKRLLLYPGRQAVKFNVWVKMASLKGSLKGRW